MNDNFNYRKYFMITFFIVSLVYFAIFILFHLRPIKTTLYRKSNEKIVNSILFIDSLDGALKTEYYFSDYQLLGGVEVTLIVEYSETSFNMEIERLETLKNDMNGKGVVKDSNCQLFNYPTYVTTYIPQKKYEYACVNYELLTITYIYIECMSKGKTSISHNLLPKIYLSDEEIFNQYCYDVYKSSEYKDYSIWLY